MSEQLDHQPAQQELPPCSRHLGYLCSSTCQSVARPGWCLIDDARFLRWLTDDSGYLDVRLAAGGRRYVAIRRMNFTFAIVGGQIGNYVSTDQRFCYHDYLSARVALEAWDGRGDPKGWHRDANTGRRVSASADEMDSNGRRVGAVGVIYHCW
jgi:hypothetical protein